MTCQAEPENSVILGVLQTCGILPMWRGQHRYKTEQLKDIRIAGWNAWFPIHPAALQFHNRLLFRFSKLPVNKRFSVLVLVRSYSAEISLYPDKCFLFLCPVRAVTRRIPSSCNYCKITLWPLILKFIREVIRIFLSIEYALRVQLLFSSAMQCFGGIK